MTFGDLVNDLHQERGMTWALLAQRAGLTCIAASGTSTRMPVREKHHTATCVMTTVSASVAVVMNAHHRGTPVSPPRTQ